MLDSRALGRPLSLADHRLMDWYARDQFGHPDLHVSAAGKRVGYRQVDHGEYISALHDARTYRDDDDEDTRRRRDTIVRVMTPPEDLPHDGATYFLAHDNRSGFGLDTKPDEHGLHQGHGLWSIAGGRGHGILDEIRKYVGNYGHRLNCFGKPQVDEHGQALDPHDSFLPKLYGSKGYVPDEQPFGSDGPHLPNGVSTNWGDDPDGSHPELHNPKLPSVVFLKLPPKMGPRQAGVVRYASLWLEDSVVVGTEY